MVRYYVRHVDKCLEPDGLLPDTSYIRDRLYCCRDVARFTRLTVPKIRRRPRVWHQRTTAEMRAWVDDLCAEWNAEYDAWLASERAASR